MSVGEFKKRIQQLMRHDDNQPIELEVLADSLLFKIVDEACKDFGKIILVQSLGKRSDPDETHYAVDEKYWNEVLEEKKDGKHGEAWFEFEDADKAVKAFLKWFVLPTFSTVNPA